MCLGNWVSVPRTCPFWAALPRRRWPPGYAQEALMPTVQDILDRKGNKIVTVSPNDTVQEAAARMQS